VDILSKDRERRRGEVDCWALRSEGRDKGGRRPAGRGVPCSAKSSTCVVGGAWESAYDFDLVGLAGLHRKGAAGNNVSVLSAILLGSPTSRLPCFLSKRKPGLTGVVGGVASSASTSGSSGMTLDVSEA
jgi:hypothetical protein